MKKLENMNELATGVSVVKFYADWCPPCKMYAPILENVSRNVDGVNFFTVNCDENRPIAEKFGVQGIPLTVVLKEGKVVEQFTGIRNAKDITNLIAKYKN